MPKISLIFWGPFEPVSDIKLILGNGSRWAFIGDTNKGRYDGAIEKSKGNLRTNSKVGQGGGLLSIHGSVVSGKGIRAKLREACMFYDVP